MYLTFANNFAVVVVFCCFLLARSSNSRTYCSGRYLYSYCFSAIFYFLNLLFSFFKFLKLCNYDLTFIYIFVYINIHVNSFRCTHCMVFKQHSNLYKPISPYFRYSFTTMYEGIVIILTI